MWTNLGIIRDDKGLENVLNEISNIRTEIKDNLTLSSIDPTYNHEWVEALEIHNMLNLAEMISRASIYRTESRGAHYRSDYPESDDVKWLRNIIIKRSGEKIKIFTEPVIRV